MKAIVIREDKYVAIEELDIADLPEGDVTVNVLYSTLNYKDALALTSSAPIAKSFPMVPGIDFVGEVINSENSDFPIGSKVLLNGWGVGEKHWGGLAEQARVKSHWLIKLPSSLSPQQAMSIGTAGYTAMLCCNALRDAGVNPENGKIVVSGATGGVGSFAVSILAKRGYAVTALSGKSEQNAYLKTLGAAEVLDREVYAQKARPLGGQDWAGAVDVAGSHTLANIIANTQYGGVVTACGLAQGMDLPSSVAPFILRGVSLMGIDSVYCPQDKRQRAWDDLASELDPKIMSHVSSTIKLEECIEAANNIMAGKVTGRYLVEM